jgi:DNA-directed RNA polymerase subunit A'
LSSRVPKIIEKIRFGFLSPDEVRKLSVTRIITADTYDEDGLPIDSGLMDSRLGTVEPGRRCKTCGNRVGDCPGHFGHIELARPVIHVGFAKLIYKALKATCRKCSRLLLPEAELEKYKKEMEEYEKTWNALSQDIVDEVVKHAVRTTVCPWCGETQRKIGFEKPTSFTEEREEGPARLTPSDIRDRLERIPNDDERLLGVNSEHARLEWTVLTVLPVPPITVRPSITLESGVRSEDDLTHKLVDVSRINQRLKENIDAGAPQLIVEDLWELLQYHVTTYFDNEVSGIPPARHRSGRALRTLAQRLKGKEGRFRSNLSGKRVDFSARTVISPDPNISINEVGVPFDVAKILTIPERVTSWNIEETKRLVRNGPEKHPGANYVIRMDGRRVDLRFVKDLDSIADSIEAGFIVERHLKEGDTVLFNRQPSLHRMSIMAHEVRVMPYRTFRLNLCVCLSGDTELFTDLGRVPIASLVGSNARFAPLSCDWQKDKAAYFSGITDLHIINPAELGLKSYMITTENGRVIKATGDHPFYTKRGIVKAGELECTDSVVVYPVEIPFAGGCPDILTKEQIMNAFPDHTQTQYTMNELDAMDLIDVPACSKKQIQLASLVGHLMGDGTLLISEEGGRVIFRAADRQDIDSLRETAHDLNLNPTSIQEFESRAFNITRANGKILRPRGRMYFFEVRRKPVAVAFKALGVPEGDRVLQEYRVPKWLYQAPRMARRAFLRAYFGCELSAPRLHTSSDSKFNQPVFKIAKAEGLSAEGFIQDIQTLLDEFGVRLSSVTTEEGNLRKDGRKSIIYVCSFAAEDDNLLALFKRIGYEFDHSKEELARLASEYITAKNVAKAKASDQLRAAVALREQGYTYEAIARAIGHHSWSTIASWLSNDRTAPGLPANFPDFDSWKASATKGLKHGFTWDKIAHIEEIELKQAYDITTNDSNHNFVAAQFLTKNCPPYNADFDGDEMNLHVPQSEEARAEAKILMRVQEQILSPRYGGPIIGGIQDYISAGYLLTRRGTYLTRKEVSSLLLAAAIKEELPPPELKNPDRWSGKDIISMVLPKDMDYSWKAKICHKCDTCKKEDCQYDAYCVVKDGRLISGVFDKNAFGAGVPESIFHSIVKNYGSDAARTFLDSITRLLLSYVTVKGFTMGIDDVELKEEAVNRIREILDQGQRKVDQLIETFNRGEMEPLPGRTLKETLEMSVMKELSEARDDAGAVADGYLGMKNHAVIMARTGARGDKLNLAQMAACVGQQSVRGERIMRGYQKRSLSHFKPGDLSSEARGFVSASYRQGLTPIEFFFHAMGGREGLVDTAVRTSTSGYMQRRLINALQDIKVEYDGTVRTSVGRIVQFKYGEDGVDPSKSYHGHAVDIDAILKRNLGTKYKR